MIHLQFSNVLNRFLTALAAGLCFIPTAHADRDVFLASRDGQVAVGSASDASPAEPDLTTRIFERVLVPGFPPFDPADYGFDEPGFFALPADDIELPFGTSAFPANADVTVNLLPLTIDGDTDSLFYWNGIGAVNFEPISAVAPGVSLVIDPIPIGTTGANGGADIHPTYRLDNGAAGVPTDGVYLSAATASISGLADSDRIFMVWLADALVTDEDAAGELLEGLESGQPIFAGKDFSFFAAAGAYVEKKLVVPEPTGVALTAIVCLAAGLLFVSRPTARS